MKKAWFPHLLRALLITYLVTYMYIVMILEKSIILLEESLEKVLNFRSKHVKLRLLVNESICSVTYLKVFHKILA